MSFAGLIIELLVAGLLAITIGYCALLNQRLKKMRADENTMRAVITELVKSTETAERAILGLRATASECNKTISARIHEAREINGLLEANISQGRHDISTNSIAPHQNPNSAAFQRSQMRQAATNDAPGADRSLARKIAEQMLAEEAAQMSTSMNVPNAGNDVRANAIDAILESTSKQFAGNAA